MLMIWETFMPIHARDILTAQEQFDSLEMLNHVTKAGNRGFTNYPPHIQPVALSMYNTMAKKIRSAKNLKIFTHQPTGMPTGFPDLYLTKLGQLVIPVIHDYTFNPFVNGRFRNMTVNPLIKLMAETLTAHQLSSGQFLNREYYEKAVDTCFSDFKVRCGTRNSTTIFNSWRAMYVKSQGNINRFIDTIIDESPRFEVHSIVVQLKTASGKMPQFGDEQFKGQTENEMLADLVEPIIKAVWLNKDSNDVIGILSKNEIDIIGDISKRLIFFVKKEFTDMDNWTDTELFQTVHPFLENTITHCISYGDVPSMNAGVAPMFQGQHLNYYDLNQSGIAPRLSRLKAHLYGTDYWMRVDGDRATVRIEHQYG